MLSITATVSRASCYAARSRDTYNVTEYSPQNTHQRAHRPACHDKTHRERTYSISQSQLTAVSRAHNEQPTEHYSTAHSRQMSLALFTETEKEYF